LNSSLNKNNSAVFNFSINKNLSFLFSYASKKILYIFQISVINSNLESKTQS